MLVNIFFVLSSPSIQITRWDLPLFTGLFCGKFAYHLFLASQQGQPNHV